LWLRRRSDVRLRGFVGGRPKAPDASARGSERLRTTKPWTARSPDHAARSRTVPARGVPVERRARIARDPWNSPQRRA
jgi:hypothetical protein